jgi:hypothetical protein
VSLFQLENEAPVLPVMNKKRQRQFSSELPLSFLRKPNDEIFQGKTVVLFCRCAQVKEVIPVSIGLYGHPLQRISQYPNIPISQYHNIPTNTVLPLSN